MNAEQLAPNLVIGGRSATEILAEADISGVEKLDWAVPR